MAGYSGTPLATKLGIRAGLVVAALDEPDGFRDWLSSVPDGVRIRRSLGVPGAQADDSRVGTGCGAGCCPTGWRWKKRSPTEIRCRDWRNREGTSTPRRGSRSSAVALARVSGWRWLYAP